MSTPTNNAPTTDYAAADKAPTAVVVVDAPAVAMAPSVDQHGLVVGKWKADIFGCFTDFVPNCLMATCCPCVSLAQTLHRVGMYSYTTVLAAFGAVYAVYLLMYLLQVVDGPYSEYTRYYGLRVGISFTYFYIAMVIQAALIGVFIVIRMRVRQAFAIPGTFIEDCFFTCCCSCCSIAQMATHTDAYDAQVCSFGPKDALPGYTFN